MKILITGAAGFIGYHLAKHLSQQGHECIAIDNLSPHLYNDLTKSKRMEILEREYSVKCQIVDINNPLFKNSMGGVELVVHLAATAGLIDSWIDPNLYFINNVHITSHLLKICAEEGVRKFIHASTSSVYGKIANGNEGRALVPVSPYGVSKLEAEKLVQHYIGEGKFDAVILRFFSVYGPWQRPDMAYAKFIDAIDKGRPIELFGDGNQSRSNTYVSDIVSAIDLIVSSDEIKNTIYNVCGDENIKLLDAVDKISQKLEKKAEIIFREVIAGDQMDTHGDASRLKAFGWQPKTTFDEGIEDQINFFRAMQGKY